MSNGEGPHFLDSGDDVRSCLNEAEIATMRIQDTTQVSRFAF